MDLKKSIINDSIIEHTICFFSSVKKGDSKLSVITNVVTKEVTFKVMGNTIERITTDLSEAVSLYKLLTI